MSSNTLNKKILIDGIYPSDLRVASIEGVNELVDFEYLVEDQVRIRGNIYLAVVVRVEPALQAAFIDYGQGQNGFLPFDDISPIYYNQPNKSKLPKIDESKIDNMSFSDWDASVGDIGHYGINSIVDISALKEEIKNEEKLSSDFDDFKEMGEQKDANQGKKIQDLIRKGQVLLVQVTKDSRGNKAASFTTYLSLIGRYSILLPNRVNKSGISRKINSFEYRSCLRKLIDAIQQFTPEHSMIIRTAANGRSLYDIKNDYLTLVKRWNWLCDFFCNDNRICLVHVEDNILSKVLRDMVDPSVHQVLVQGDQVYKDLLRVDNEMNFNLSDKIYLYQDKIPIFAAFDLDKKISDLYHPHVTLKSGGSIVINPAEGMTLIDINSGKSNTYVNLEDTALQTNIEAAIEIARQISLRDISGLIVIDFIDMQDIDNNLLVRKVLEKALIRDPARLQIGNISKFGLLEMSRQRTKLSFLESNTDMCPACLGKGVIRNLRANDILILRSIESEISADNRNISLVNVYACKDVVLSVFNNKSREILALEEKYKIKINFYVEENIQSDKFSIEKIQFDDTEENYRWISSPY